MRMIIIVLLCLELFSCVTDDVSINSYVIGTWRSAQKDTEWGPSIMEVKFNTDNTMTVTEYFIKQNNYPLTVNTKYEFKNNYLISPELEKGKPILITKENDDIIMHFIEMPIKLIRVNKKQ